MQRSTDMERLQRKVREKISRHPTPLVFALDLDGQKYWIKRRPLPKKTLWHGLQALSASLLRLSWLQPTVSAGGPESLQDEAARLALLRDQGISVPEPILCEDDYLVTEDHGVPLDGWLKALPTLEERQYWLERAMRLLQQVHTARFAHGRPLPKDIVVRDGALTLLDLEEDPLRVMSLAEAQARDMWLFMTGVVRWLPDRAAAADLFVRSHAGMASEAQKALRRIVALARPFSWVLAKTIVHRLGRDLRCAVMANEVMARVLRSPMRETR